MSEITGRTFIRYSLSFKQQVVREIEEEGSGICYLQKKYGIRGAETIQRWLVLFGRHHLLNKVIRVETMNEKNRLKELEAENQKLKSKLAHLYMAQECLEEVINLANKEFKTDLKKNFGGQSQTSSDQDTK